MHVSLGVEGLSVLLTVCVVASCTIIEGCRQVVFRRRTVWSRSISDREGDERNGNERKGREE